MPNCNVIGKIVFSEKLEESDIVELSYFLTQAAINNRFGLNLDVNLTNEGQYFYPIKNYRKEGFIPYEIIDSPLTNECSDIFDNIGYGPKRRIVIERTGLSRVQKFYEDILKHPLISYVTVYFYDKHSSDPEWQSKTDVYVKEIKVGELCAEIERTPRGKHQPEFPDVRLKIVSSDIQKAHDFCWSNRRDLEQSSVCGCFHCLKIYSPKEINQWIDDGGVTALCPHCGIDSVIAEKSGYPITKEFLSEMNKYWFRKV